MPYTVLYLVQVLGLLLHYIREGEASLLPWRRAEVVPIGLLRTKPSLEIS